MPDLQTQIDLLRRQLDALQQVVEIPQRRTPWPFLWLGAAFLLGGLILGPLWQGHAAYAAQDEKDAKALVCSSLKLVNRDGRKIAELDGDKDGGFLKIYGQDGLERMFVGVNDRQGGGLITLRDREGRVRTYWGVTDLGFPSIGFRNSLGRIDVFLGSSMNHWGGVLKINASTGQSAALFEANEIGEGSIKLFDKQDKLVVNAGSDGKGGFIELRNSALNTNRITVPSMESLLRRLKEIAP